MAFKASSPSEQWAELSTALIWADPSYMTFRATLAQGPDSVDWRTRSVKGDEGAVEVHVDGHIRKVKASQDQKELVAPARPNLTVSVFTVFTDCVKRPTYIEHVVLVTFCANV